MLNINSYRLPIYAFNRTLLCYRDEIKYRLPETDPFIAL